MLCVGASVLLAAYGRHGMEDAESQMRWGIAVEYARVMGMGLVIMVLVRVASKRLTKRMWPERMLVLGMLLFSGTVGAEALSPDSPWLSRVGWAAPLGGIFMAMSWLTFVFEFIRNNNPQPS